MRGVRSLRAQGVSKGVGIGEALGRLGFGAWV